MSDEFYDDEILLTSYEILFFSFLIMSAKFIIFNIMKLFMKFLFAMSAKFIIFNIMKLFMKFLLRLTLGVNTMLLSTLITFF